MTEKQLIKQLKTLKEIKPGSAWVILTKERILGQPLTEKERFSFISNIVSIFNVRPLLKPVLASVICLAFFVGILSIAQGALPGDLLYSVKKASEQAKFGFVPEKDKTQVQLDLTQKRLNELTRVAEANLGKNLAPAVEEVEKSIKETVKTLKEASKKSNDVKTAKEVKERVEKIVKQKEVVEEILATKIESEELEQSINSYYKDLVEREIEELEKQALTAEQEETLKEAKQFFEEGNYQEALEKIFILSY